MTRRWAYAVAVAVLAACTGAGSGARERTPAGTPAMPDEHGTGPAGATAGAQAVPVATGTHTDTVLQPGSLGFVSAARVTHWKGPGGQPFEVTLRTADPEYALARKFGTITLQTSLRARAPDLGQYPCTSCHLGRGTVLADERIADAHQNITVRHPEQAGATCSTCHAPDNVELLALRSGERATLDHAYRLCAQCHFAQADAWAGGAHGKRLDGWQGRRVVMGCADCHDPHNPALEPRIPFRAPQIERRRGRDQ